MSIRIIGNLVALAAAGLSVVECETHLAGGDWGTEGEPARARVAIPLTDNESTPDAAVENVEAAAANGGACEAFLQCAFPVERISVMGEPVQIVWSNADLERARVVITSRWHSSEIFASTEVGLGHGAFEVNDLPAGEYEVRLWDESSQPVGIGADFSVHVRLSVARTEYAPYNYVAVEWRHCGNQAGDWVAIAPDGSRDATVTKRVSTSGADGGYAFGPLRAGTYRARFFSEGSADKACESEPITVPEVSLAELTSVDGGSSFGCGVTKHHHVRCWGSSWNAFGGGGEPGLAARIEGISNAILVSAGQAFACAVLSDGTLRCWGENSAGQLGDGTSTDSWSPVTVAGISNATAVSAGMSHTCAVLGDGRLRCWGANYVGELGDGTTTPSRVPVEVSRIADATAVSIGDYHSCSVSRAGKVHCWGANPQGQLGDGTLSDSIVPVEVTGVSDAVSVKAGRGHTCALSRSGVVRCWGANSDGQLGNGTLENSTTPGVVSSINDALALSVGGDHACALVRTGTVKCWGQNGSGQVGAGNAHEVTEPIEVAGLSNVVALGTGLAHSCAILKGGETRCWGSISGAQADGSSEYTSEIGGFWGTRALSAGQSHVCAVTHDGHVECWGGQWRGELGSGARSGSQVPVLVAGIEGAVSVSAGVASSCAVIRDGSVFCWGPGDPPAPILGLANAVQAVSVGWGVACALLVDGRISCWGENGVGQRGDGTTVESPSPTLVSDITNAVVVSVEEDFACAVLSDGTVRCWGAAHNGQLGDGRLDGVALTPVQALGVEGAVGVETWAIGTCANLRDGTVWCWGEGKGQDRLTPEQITGITNATALSRSCARLADGTVRCWGYNNGSLGIGTVTQWLAPVQMAGVSNALFVAAGSDFTCVLHNQSRIRCWGRNDAGQFGNGSDPFALRRPTPILRSLP